MSLSCKLYVERRSANGVCRYVYTFGAFASAVAEAVQLPAGPIFQAFDTSVHFDASEAYVFDV